MTPYRTLADTTQDRITTTHGRVRTKRPRSRCSSDLELRWEMNRGTQSGAARLSARGKMSGMTKSTKKAPAKTAAKTTPSKTATPKASKTPKADTTSEGVDKLGKTGLIDQLAAQTTLSRTEATSVVDAVLEIVVEALKAGKTVGLPGLGTLNIRATAERQGVRPGTAEKITIPAGKKVGFKVAADLKKAL